MFPPNVNMLLWEMCDMDRSMRLISTSWRATLPPLPPIPQCIKLLADVGSHPCPLPSAWTHVDRIEICVPAVLNLSKKKHSHRAHVAAALQDILKDVVQIKSMSIYMPSCVVSTQCVSSLLHRVINRCNVRSLEIQACSVRFDGGLEDVLSVVTSGRGGGYLHFLSNMCPRVVTNYKNLRQIHIHIIHDEQGIIFNNLLRAGGQALRHLEVLDIQWISSMSVFDNTTFANLPRLSDLRIRFGYTWDLDRLPHGRRVVIEVPKHCESVDVGCNDRNIHVGLDFVIVKIDLLNSRAV
jgi:hypothetical protein